MNKILKLYKWLNVLSIDVAVGAVCSLAWLADFFHVQLRVQAYFALGLTVWIIYTIDHLLDAYRIKHQASSYRHHFHQQYFKPLIFVVMVAVMADVLCVFFIRTAVLYSGILLSTLIVVYLLFNRWLGYFKEFFVAVLYSGGVLLPIVSIGGINLLIENAWAILGFLTTALTNVILFSWFDYERDKNDNQLSMVLTLGKARTQKFILFLLMLQLLVAVMVLLVIPNAYLFLGILIVMNAVLFMLFEKHEYFSIDDRYRLVGDAIFFLPLVHFLFTCV